MTFSAGSQFLTSVKCVDQETFHKLAVVGSRFDGRIPSRNLENVEFEQIESFLIMTLFDSLGQQNCYLSIKTRQFLSFPLYFFEPRKLSVEDLLEQIKLVELEETDCLNLEMAT